MALTDSEYLPAVASRSGPQASDSPIPTSDWLGRLVRSTEVLLQDQQALSLQKQRRSEALAGLARQLQLLRAMHQGGRAGRDVDIPESAQLGQWDALRDYFSLHPSNGAFADAFRDLSLELLGGDRSALAALWGHPLILHLSCQARLELAFSSIVSFAGYPQAGHHVVVVGGSTRLKFRHLDRGSWLLELPLSDAYEQLHSKLFLAVALLWLWLRPARLMKLDDDLHLANGDALLNYLQGLEAAGIAYGGRMIRSKHRNIHHGWHLGKCADTTMDQMGYQFPLGSSYAAGGSGYVLTGAAIAEVAYGHLAMRRFLELPCLGMEDGLVGLMLQLAKLDGHDCDTAVLPGLAVQPALTP